MTPHLTDSFAALQEEELRECTFKPETTPVPAYITDMAEVG